MSSQVVPTEMFSDLLPVTVFFSERLDSAGFSICDYISNLFYDKCQT